MRFPVCPAGALRQGAVLHGAAAFLLVDAGRELQLLTGGRHRREVVACACCCMCVLLAACPGPLRHHRVARGLRSVNAASASACGISRILICQKCFTFARHLAAPAASPLLIYDRNNESGPAQRCKWQSRFIIHSKFVCFTVMLMDCY